MISAYQSLLAYKKGDWQSYLEDIGLEDVFKPLFKPLEEDILKEVVLTNTDEIIKYIVLAYSIESEMIVVGADWHKTKKKIYEYVCGRPVKNLYEAVVLLNSPSIIKAINNWLEFSDDDLFTQIQMLKDLQIEMRITSISVIRKASMEIDFDQKFRNAEYAIKLKRMIKEAESELIQNSEKLKDAIKEMKPDSKKKNTLSVESMLKEGSNGLGS